MKLRNFILASAVSFCISQYTYAEANPMNASGSFIVAAPTDEMGVSKKGIWFVDPMTNGPSLDLPDLDATHVYEAWLINMKSHKVFSIGKFKNRMIPDSDGSGPYAGLLSVNFPQLPGSDFVKICKDLTNGHFAVSITVEAYPDYDSRPSNVTVLKAAIPKGTALGAPIQLSY